MQQPSTMLKEGSASASKYHKNGRDAICKLPDDFIYQIIRHLTLRGAVKPSVLLHRWKSVFCYLKDLRFDWVNMFQDSGNSVFLETCESPCREYRDKFVRAVNQFLDFIMVPKCVNSKSLSVFPVIFRTILIDGSVFPLEWVLKSSLPDYTVTVLVAGEVMMSLEDKVRENIFSGVSFLKICSSEDMDRGKLEHSECVHKHLKKVDIGGFYDTLNQNEFAIYLLKHAISLERLVINPVGKYCSGLRQSWDEGEREKSLSKPA